MKKNSIARVQLILRKKRGSKNRNLTVGLDLGDRTSSYCILDGDGEKTCEGKVQTTKKDFAELLGKLPASRVALEVGSHSPWVSRQLKEMGHDVVVANPHRVKLIGESLKKNDRIDAELLARLGRMDRKQLYEIRHRGAEAQADLAILRARAELVEARSKRINSARGLAKPMGERLRSCDADYVKESLADGLSQELQRVLRPMLKGIEAITQPMEAYNKQIAKMEEKYPEVKLLKQVDGVGPLIALTFLLTIEDVDRFEHSRDVGPYLGLTPKYRDSGKSSPELGISKQGDTRLRWLMVQGAHCVMRGGAPDSDLKAWGKAKLGKGKKVSKQLKRKVIVAVARKLAVLLHHLWATGEVYDPQHNRKAAAEKAQGKRKVA